MKVRVIKEFHDKNNFAKVYACDSTIDLPAERAKELKALGLVVEVRERNNVKTSK